MDSSALGLFTGEKHLFSDLFGEKYDNSRGHSVPAFILESELSDLYPRSIDNDGEKDGTSVSYADSSSSKLRRADLKFSVFA